jgi:RNA polymerase primary sigma factor
LKTTVPSPQNLCKLLSVKEEQDLARRLAEGSAVARQHLIEANLRLVVSIAKRFANKGLPLLDLIEEGNIGLMKAVDRFNSWFQTFDATS